MRLLQVGHTVPDFGTGSDSLDMARHIKSVLRRAFYEELDLVLEQTPGGVLLAAPRITEKTVDDFLSNQPYRVYKMSAVVEELPLPPEYRLIGGPADGYIVRTRGERIWLVPVMGPPPTVASYLDNDSAPRLVAEYERQGDTAAYFYRRTTSA